MQAFQAVTRLAPMQQQDRPQTFELDEPVLCVGGRLKVRQQALGQGTHCVGWRLLAALFFQ